MCWGGGFPALQRDLSGLLRADPPLLGSLFRGTLKLSEELPDLIFKIGQHSFTLPPSAYVLKVSSTISDGTTFNSCIPAFMGVDMQTPEGQVFGSPQSQQPGRPKQRHSYMGKRGKSRAGLRAWNESGWR